ncbi:MAG: Maf family protein [Candidatus Spechtbacterales bacterium]
MKELILASGSPRRKELLEQAGFSFQVEPSDFEEDMTLEIPPAELAQELSRGKAEAVARNNADAVVLGADTFIVFEGTLLGKPHTEEEAVRTLQRLNGTSHTVITGFTVIEAARDKRVSRAVETTVYFCNLSEEEIGTYVQTHEPLDKAGAYAIQGRGAIFVEKIEGDFYNVVGLPLCEVARVLKDFGITPA